MHEKAKSFLDKMGTSHHSESELNENPGMHHEEMHNIEREHFSGKKHHHETEI